MRGMESGAIYKNPSKVSMMSLTGPKLLRKKTSVDFDKEKEILSRPRPEEDEREKKLAKDLLKERIRPYKERKRDVFDGPLRIERPIEVREDFYAYCFLYWLKRKVIVDDDEESDADEC